MIAVYQSIVDKGDGDCFRAAIASLLELTIEQVPHFIRFNEEWHSMFRGYMRLFGWEYAGTCGIYAPRGLLLEDSIDGLFLCSVPSLTFDDVMHSIIVDIDGDCVHDPNPNQKYEGLNIYKDILPRKNHVTWSMFERRDKEQLKQEVSRN